MQTTVRVAVEGPTDVPVARCLLEHAGLSMGPVFQGRGKKGLDNSLTGYNRAAEFSPWLVIRDLDHDEPCAGALAARLVPNPSPGMFLRIAVREMESWLLADRDAIARYLSVSATLIPANPDALHDPKEALVNLARRSPKRNLREDIVPAPGLSASVGPGYTARVTEFSMHQWRPEVARTASRSLDRCMTALDRLRKLRLSAK